MRQSLASVFKAARPGQVQACGERGGGRAATVGRPSLGTISVLTAFRWIMIGAIALLLVCQLAGEGLHQITGLPLPGSVIGMLLLVAWLALVRKERPALDAVTGWLTAHLSILFVPAAVGVIEQGEMLRLYGFGLAIATAVSTLLTMVVTVLSFRWAIRTTRADGLEERAGQ